MNSKTPKPDLEMGSAFSHPNALRDILLVAIPIIILGTIGNLVGLSTLAGGLIINLGYVLAIIFGALILKRQDSGWHKLGLAKPASWFKTILLGIGAWVGAVVVFVTIQITAFGILTALGLAPSEVDQSRFNPIVGNLPLFILMLVLAWTTIAFGEELFYRAFLITRLVNHTAIGQGFSILISGILFGAVHFAEGPVGILSNGAFGILFGWIYVKSKRNLWITIIGHGLINTLRFVLLYIGAT